MDSKAPVALAIGVGYLLGRTHKMRWALLLGAAAATGRINGVSSQIMSRGAETLRSTPELAKLADSGQQLLEAGRSALVSGMSSRAASMGNALEDRAKRADPGTAEHPTDEDFDEPDDEYDDQAEDAEDQEDEEAEIEDEDEQQVEQDDVDRPPAARDRDRRGSVGRRSGR